MDLKKSASQKLVSDVINFNIALYTHKNKTRKQNKQYLLEIHRLGESDGRLKKNKASEKCIKFDRYFGTLAKKKCNRNVNSHLREENKKCVSLNQTLQD